MRILTVLLKERRDGSAAPVPPSDTTCTRLKRGEKKKRKLGCESSKARRAKRRRRREEQDKEEEEEKTKREEEGAEHLMNAPTGSPNKEIRIPRATRWGHRRCVCVCRCGKWAGRWDVFEKKKNKKKKTVTCDKCDPWSTYLLNNTSLFHSNTVFLTISTRDSATMGELSPSLLHVPEGGRAPLDLPPAHDSQPNPPQVHLHLRRTVKGNATIE